MDVWLNSAAPRTNHGEKGDELVRQHVAQCRDERRQRLEAKGKKNGK